MLTLQHIKKALLAFSALCLLSNISLANAAKTEVQKINFTKNNHLEINISKKASFNIFRLTKPSRLVVDISNAQLTTKTKKPILPFFAKSFRHTNSNNTLRLVFDLTQEITLQRTAFEQIKEEKGGKLIAEIEGIKGKATAAKKAVKLDNFVFTKMGEFDKSPEASKYKFAKPVAKKIVKKKPTRKRKKIIVIDSGHGGKDPGTIGKFARTKEKNITLSYAKELGKQLIRTGRYKVYLTRDNDIFIPLRKRVAIARRKKADLFISLHANATTKKEINGFSIYTLSETSSDEQAKKLARKENRADIIHGVNFKNASPDIMKTLIDLSQRESMNGSSSFANVVINSIKKSDINILQNTHRFAGFAVLTAPDMISVLIELGYLSNKYEEKLLNSVRYKRRVAKSLAKAIDEYFKKQKN